MLDGEQRGHQAFDFIVGTTEGVFWVRDRLGDVFLGGCVPRHPNHLELFSDWADRKAVARRDQASDHFDIVAQCELTKAFDRILCIGFFFDDKLNLAAKNAARRIHAIGPPLRGDECAFADAPEDAGARRQHADLNRTGLRK